MLEVSADGCAADFLVGEDEGAFALAVLLLRLRVGVLSADLSGGFLLADDMIEAGREGLRGAGAGGRGASEAGVAVAEGVAAGFSLGAEDLGTTPAMATAS